MVVQSRSDRVTTHSSLKEIEVLDARKLSTRELNSTMKKLVSQGRNQMIVLNPDARHNLAVGMLNPCGITFEGSVGYYCCAYCDSVDVIIKGNSGWGLGDNLMSGKIIVKKNAGASAAASMRGGEIFVEGNAGARAGISMKGGLLIIAGSSGFLTGFMMQKGSIIVLGDIGNAAGDSMYEGTIYIGGNVGSLGADAKLELTTHREENMIRALLKKWSVESDKIPPTFKKIVSAKRLYHYDALEPLEKERLVI